MEKGLPHLPRFGFRTNREWDRFVLPFEKEMDIVPALKKDRYIRLDISTVDLGPEDIRLNCDEEDRKALKAPYPKVEQQIDCGTISIGVDTVENTIQAKDSWGY